MNPGYKAKSRDGFEPNSCLKPGYNSKSRNRSELNNCLKLGYNSKSKDRFESIESFEHMSCSWIYSKLK